jgi:hypothetical protein
MASAKDYRETARIIADAMGKDPSAEVLRTCRNMIREFADMFETGNERFDRERFYKAAGFYHPKPDYF